MRKFNLDIAKEMEDTARKNKIKDHTLSKKESEVILK